MKVLEKWKQHINKNNRPDDFAKYIAPADSLSRTNIQAFKAKILKSFPKIKKFDELDAIPWAANEVRLLAMFNVLVSYSAFLFGLVLQCLTCHNFKTVFRSRNAGKVIPRGHAIVIWRVSSKNPRLKESDGLL